MRTRAHHARAAYPRARQMGWAALLAALLAAGAWYKGAGPAAAVSAPVALAPVAGGPLALSSSSSSSSPSSIGQPQPAWLGDVRVPVEPLADRLRRLGASGDPVEAYRAYRLVRACTALRTRSQPQDGLAVDDVLAGIPDPSGFCAGMTERMRMDSVALLERAARAGVDGAMAALLDEGPFGDPAALVTRPTDPLVKDWKERVNRMLSEQAGKGDWSSLYLVFTGFMFGNPAIDADRQSALAYGIALRDILVKVDGMTEDEAIPFNTPFLDQVKAGLSREQQDQATVQAAAIVDTALRQRHGPQPTI